LGIWGSPTTLSPSQGGCGFGTRLHRFPARQILDKALCPRKAVLENDRPNKKAAEIALIETAAKLHHGHDVQLKKITFEAFCDLWLHEYGTVRLKPSTLRSYHSVLDHLISVFGKLPLGRIAPLDIDRYTAAAIRDQHLAKATVVNHVSLLRKLCNQAVAWGYLLENPCARVERIRTDSNPPRFLRPHEFRRLVSHARFPFRALFIVAGLTGLRKGELLALQWDDVDWERHLLHVRWSSDMQQRISPKSKSSRRSIVATNTVIKALDELRASMEVATGSIFPGSGECLMSPRRVNYELDVARTAASLQRMRFHDLRHTYASFMLASGANIKVIQQQMGHSSIQTTLDIYGHLLVPSMQSVDHLDRFVGLDAESSRMYRGSACPTEPRCESQLGQEEERNAENSCRSQRSY
jgi:integrase